jgi:hypothetical protein
MNEYELRLTVDKARTLREPRRARARVQQRGSVARFECPSEPALAPDRELAVSTPTVACLRRPAETPPTALF